MDRIYHAIDGMPYGVEGRLTLEFNEVGGDSGVLLDPYIRDVSLRVPLPTRKRPVFLSLVFFIRIISSCSVPSALFTSAVGSCDRSV